MPLGEKSLFQRGGERRAALKALCSNFIALLSPIPKLMITPESWEGKSGDGDVLSAPDAPERGGLSPVRVPAAPPDPDPPPERGRAPGSAPRGTGEGLPVWWRWRAAVGGAEGELGGGRRHPLSRRHRNSPFLPGTCFHPGCDAGFCQSGCAAFFAMLFKIKRTLGTSDDASSRRLIMGRR